MITLKEQLIQDILYADSSKFVVLVEEDNETMFIMPNEDITLIIHNFFDDNLKGTPPFSKREIKANGWRLIDYPFAEEEKKFHFAESKITNK